VTKTLRLRLASTRVLNQVNNYNLPVCYMPTRNLWQFLSFIRPPPVSNSKPRMFNVPMMSIQSVSEPHQGT
jgi:hypothetical protein